MDKSRRWTQTMAFSKQDPNSFWKDVHCGPCLLVDETTKLYLLLNNMARIGMGQNPSVAQWTPQKSLLERLQWVGNHPQKTIGFHPWPWFQVVPGGPLLPLDLAALACVGSYSHRWKKCQFLSKVLPSPNGGGWRLAEGAAFGSFGTQRCFWMFLVVPPARGSDALTFHSTLQKLGMRTVRLSLATAALAREPWRRWKRLSFLKPWLASGNIRAGATHGKHIISINKSDTSIRCFRTVKIGGTRTWQPKNSFPPPKKEPVTTSGWSLLGKTSKGSKGGMTLFSALPTPFLLYFFLIFYFVHLICCGTVLCNRNGFGDSQAGCLGMGWGLCERLLQLPRENQVLFCSRSKLRFCLESSSIMYVAIYAFGRFWAICKSLHRHSKDKSTGTISASKTQA